MYVQLKYNTASFLVYFSRRLDLGCKPVAKVVAMFQQILSSTQWLFPSLCRTISSSRISHKEEKKNRQFKAPETCFSTCVHDAHHDEV